ncbi:uncharacterized protein BDFB_004454, partial [Asbolus verrucosus]
NPECIPKTKRILLVELKQSVKRKSEITKISELDKPQKLSHHSNAIDGVYFNGASKNGDYLVTGMARRKNKLIDGFMYLLIESSGLGLLETPKLPGTSLYQNEENEEYAAEGIKLTPIEAMKKWRISYEGKMKRYHQRTELVDVKIDAEWSSDLPYFNFDTDMDSCAMAKSMAYEKFSKEYFDNLKRNHQTHYEQHGDVKGTATINGKNYDICINAVRDHSFGLQREWRNFHSLTIGYVYSAEDKKIYAVKSCDLQLYQHGEDGNPPKDYAFTFEAGKKLYTIQVNVLHSPHFYISKDWESKIVERLCTFSVNGVKGWGAAEWQYRNVDEKNVEDYNKN